MSSYVTSINWTNITDLDVYYKIFRQIRYSSGSWSDWEQINMYQETEKINVLNVYPSQIDGYKGQASNTNTSYTTHLVNYTFGEDKKIYSLPNSASLKVWLEGGTINDHDTITEFQPVGINPNTSEQMIFVTPISINDFESNISTNPDFIYEYDIIFFGTWEGSSGYNIKTETAENIISEYISNGYGVIASCDTLGNSFYVNNKTESLLTIRNLFGVVTFGADDNITGTNGTTIRPNYTTIHSTRIINQRKGLLTTYPYKLSNDTMEISNSSTNLNGIIKGDIWYKYDTIEEENESDFLENNFYLSTHNNTAIINLCNSNNNTITKEELKILTNLIYYLKKRNYNTYIDQITKDTEAPIIRDILYDPTIYSAKITAEDIDSTYRYKVFAYSVSNESNYVASNEITINILTGINYYNYTITPTENIERDNLTKLTKDTIIPLSREQIQNGMYLHIFAVDRVGNIGDIKSWQIPIPTPTPYPTASLLPSNLTYSLTITFTKSISMFNSLLNYSYITQTETISNLVITFTELIVYNYSYIFYTSFSDFYTAFYNTYPTYLGKDDISIVIISSVSVVVALIICAIVVAIIIVYNKKYKDVSRNSNEMEVVNETTESFSLNNSFNPEEDKIKIDDVKLSIVHSKMCVKF